ncbi:DUF2937 family protein [uncultured Paraglaciecola sp.]|uniref:DUF2937 family protein n=1 Tax=uncultured Paraglaciecola sp. TaxID=1765024 RepID=UPI002596E583|nr:DUF2937 family protein [uncultured Paraglaciecola sp.]
MKKLCIDYLRLTLFCSGLLIGIQVPAVVDQYEKRVDAQLTEAQAILAGFQQTAKRYFQGDIQALLKHYELSEDAVFRHDAQNIRYITERVSSLEAEQNALLQSAIHRVFHVLVTPERETFRQTMEQYSYMILIDLQALVWGVLFGFLSATLVEGVLHLFGYCVMCLRPHKHKDNT